MLMHKVDKSRCSDHPALTGSPPNSGGEEITKEPHQEGKRLVNQEYLRQSVVGSLDGSTTLYNGADLKLH